jgi:signal transduction histidine kinase
MSNTLDLLGPKRRYSVALTELLSKEPSLAQDLATIVGMLPDVVFKCVKRADGKIYWVLNEGKLAEEFGLTTREVEGKSLEELFPAPVAERLLPHFERSFAGEAHEFVNELGGRYFKHFPQPVFDQRGRVTAVVGFVTEVTNLVLADDQIRALNDELRKRVVELEQTNHDLESANEQLSAYGHTVSHDLRIPLAAMLLTVGQLVRALPERSEKVERYLERLRASIHRMTALIEDILLLARLSAGDLRRSDLDLSALAEEVVAEIRASDPSRTVRVTIEPGLRAFGDPRLIRVVLTNLLANAWKYSQGTSDPCIEVGADRDRFSGYEGARPSAFFVRDNGIGFDMVDTGRIFQSFERLHTEREFEGSGVGLSTTRRILDAHGGEIYVESAPGKGATFSFTLPDLP